METVPEVIITAGSNVSVYDAETGNVIATYKMGEFAPKTLTLIGEDFLIGALINEPKLKLWTLNKLRVPEYNTSTCRGLVNVLTATSCGTYCVAGIKEEIHIWRVSSGELLNIVNRHYQDISCLRFSSDDSHLFSGGKDGHVITWILSQLIGVHIERDQVKPRHVWNHHSSEITDIYPGSLGSASRVVTTSLDMTCKVYEIDSGILLSTICMDIPLTSVVMDTMEYYIFLGADNGCIYRVNTYESLPKEFHFNDTKKIEFKAHEQKITSLSISYDGEKLMSASDDKSCRLWNIASMTCLLNLSMEGGFTNAFLALKPAAFTGAEVFPEFQIHAQFKREFDDFMQKGIRKCTLSKMVLKPTTTMNLASPDELYSKILLEKSTKEEMSIPEQKFYENIYQESLHGGVVTELKAVNNQMYSYLIHHGLDNLPQYIPE